MPTVLRVRGLRFFFFSNEVNPREPAHIHVEKDRCEVKFWLRPQVQLAYNDGYDARTLRELTVLVWQNRRASRRSWRFQRFKGHLRRLISEVQGFAPLLL